MAKKTTKQTKEEQALALTSAGLFHTFEKVVPKGATTIHVLEAAMMLIGNSLAQIEATPMERRAVLHKLEDYMLKRIEGFKDEK